MRAARMGLALSIALGGCMLVQAKHGGGVSGGAAIGGGGAGGEPSGGGDGAPVASVGGGAEMVTVPNVIGKTPAEAAALAKAAGFSTDVEEAPLDCDTANPGDGQIKCQDPDPGQSVRRYTMIHIEVFHDVDPFPNVIRRGRAQGLLGLSVDKARAQLAAWGFRGTIEIMHDVTQSDVKGCDDTHVCDWEPLDIDKSDRVVLKTRKPVVIGAPPP
jgi:PASTA domain